MSAHLQWYRWTRFSQFVFYSNEAINLNKLMIVSSVKQT